MARPNFITVLSPAPDGVGLAHAAREEISA
jgi:hypothetical protein